VADHPLILGLVLSSFILEKLHAALAEGDGDLYSLFTKHQILRPRKEVIDDL